MQSMVEMLNIPQIYGTQYHDHQIHHEYHTTRNNKNNNNTILNEKISKASYYNNNINNNNNNNNNKIKNYQSLSGNIKTITSSLTSPTTTTITTTTSNDKQTSHTKGGGGGRTAVFTDIYASLSSLQSIKSPTHYIEKFINLDLFKNYERLKLSNKYLPTHTPSLSTKSPITDNNVFYKKVSQQQQQAKDKVEEEVEVELNCLQDKNCNKLNIDTDVAGIYESVRFNVQNQLKPTTIAGESSTTNMINKCSENVQSSTPATVAASASASSSTSATLQNNFQKLPECDQDSPKDTVSSGPSSSTSDINSDNPIYKHLQMPHSTTPNKRNPIERITKNGSVRIYVDACPIYSQAPQNANESASENSSSSIAATTTTTYSSSTVQRTSSASSSGEYQGSYHALNYATYGEHGSSSKSCDMSGNTQLERLQRRKLMQMIASLDQQNKALQRELIRERRRRSEELSRVMKSLLCFESKLKSDMKSANQRMQEKDIEICRLTRQNRALKKGFMQAQFERTQTNRQTHDEGVIVTDDNNQAEIFDKLGMDYCQPQTLENNLLEDCLVLEALQCINCRKQFYDIGSKEGWTQTTKNKEENTKEHGSSSDDTVSSSFYGARRSVRYTSKRTAGTFRDYMRSRAMHVDDTLLVDGLNWENTSTLSRDSNSSTSNEKLNCCTQDSPAAATAAAVVAATEEDDGIFSPTQDDEFEEETEINNEEKSVAIVAAVNKQVKTTTPPELFSEASPKQIYETSADDWYASASDQDDLAEGCNAKCYTLAAVNPVLECVNQILLQQTMEETHTTENKDTTKTTVTVQSNLPRRSSLSGRRQGRSNSTNEENSQKGSVRNKSMARKRVHFSTKNSMVHLPRQESDNEQELEKSVEQKRLMIPINYFSTTPSKSTMIKINASSSSSPPTNGMPLVMQDGVERVDTLNYESIYSNEYEPIGSEQNSSNLYVEMETERLKCMQKSEGTTNNDTIKICKTPPELPPKPANLMKFKKSLLQQVASGDLRADNNNSVLLEPEYCSISEVNVGITSVQIVADVHNAPESVLSSNDLETTKNFQELTFANEEVATVNSDETCAASQKTEEVEEIFADIPKLPNVAAIIVPKQAKYQQQNIILNQNNTKSTTTMLSDYLSMTPKSPKFQTVQKLLINSSESSSTDNLRLAKTHKVVITNGNNLHATEKNNIHINNVYKNNNHNNSLIKINSSNNLLESVTTLPLQEEFDWYNLDAEYGKAKVSVNEHKVQNGLLEEINEDHENERADEYKLDEEFCLASEHVEEIELNNNNNNEEEEEEEEEQEENDNDVQDGEVDLHVELNAVIRENIESRNKTKKLHKNLDTFEKFIEGSGLSTKPLPHKRKIYFAGPFV